MLNVGKIENGIVIDHIPAGKSMDIYRYLGLGELDSCVAIIKKDVYKRQIISSVLIQGLISFFQLYCNFFKRPLIC